MRKLQIHRLLLFLDLHQHKPPFLWLWDPTQRFQITTSNELDATTMFYQCLIIDLTLVNSCIVRRYNTSQISQRVIHKSSKSIQNMARISLLYLEKFRWNPKCFCELWACLKILQKTVLAIFDRSGLILDRSSKAELHFFFLQSARFEPWNNHI